jgi:hypothetical protein
MLALLGMMGVLALVGVMTVLAVSALQDIIVPLLRLGIRAMFSFLGMMGL